ncbi:MAG: insulinase family protein [Synechococcaceae cyanobacterium SM2_3_1]|nr:insulinase family protein [Synechococcaceae cyanobacterium SM2_3_1]
MHRFPCPPPSLPVLWMRRTLLILFATLFCLSAQPGVARTVETSPESLIGPYLDQAVARVSDFELENGLQFLVFERHQAPVISFITYVDVGGANEAEGKTGTAHFLEHLAFKGTSRLGTRDYEAEKKVLQQLEQVFEQLLQARSQGREEDVQRYQQQVQDLRQQASQYVVQNEFGQIVEQAGGVGLNAFTSMDATVYSYNFPSNKLELWMSLESERFLDPVFREFYEEREVILEERRARVDNSPIGQMIEAMQATAFQVHPYRRPVIGYPEDLTTLTPSDVRTFFDTYYIPTRMIMAIVGDVNPQEVQRLAQVYFGRYTVQSAPPPLEVQEPPQQQPREVERQLQTQPWYLEAYHAPAITDPDYMVHEILAGILTSGRTSRLYQSLVQTQLALTVEGFSGFPGDTYPNLLLFYALTAPGHELQEVETVLHQEIERLQKEPVTVAELDRVKTQIQVSTLQSLASNQGLAQSLATYAAKTGNWRNLFLQLDQLAQITPAEVQRVAQETLQPQNRTIGRLLTQEETP